jgi:2-polyprenyl-3-methyl-5-hydroxy-6-metoxy-1,4-benzoquinol methylase
MNEDAVYYQLNRPEMHPFLPGRTLRALEIGCAEGNFIQVLPSECEVWGCEANSEIALRAAGNQRFFKVLSGIYEEVEPEIPDGYFDLIICNDVIEHMPDHDRFLASAFKKLSPTGVLVGSVPNVRFIAHLFELIVDADWRYRDSGILDRTHQRYFTFKSLTRSLNQNGFEIELLKGINPVMSRRWRLLMAFLRIVSFGRFSDMSYLQCAFRARKKPSTATL